MKLLPFKDRCLTESEIARFLDRKEDSRSCRRAIRHMARCSACLEKALEARAFLQGIIEPVPYGVARKAFAEARKAAAPPVPAQRPGRGRYLLPLSAAATVLLIVAITLYLAGLRPATNPPLAGGVLEGLIRGSGQGLTASLPAVEDTLRHERPVPEVPKQRRLARAQRVPAEREISHEDTLWQAGYIYFLLRNSPREEARLTSKIYVDLAASQLNHLQGMSLLKKRNYASFQKLISALPDKERKDFYEGYLSGMLLLSDKDGAVDREAVERGKRLVYTASADEIRSYMLYRR